MKMKFILSLYIQIKLKNKRKIIYVCSYQTIIFMPIYLNLLFILKTAETYHFLLQINYTYQEEILYIIIYLFLADY